MGETCSANLQFHCLHFVQNFQFPARHTLTSISLRINLSEKFQTIMHCFATLLLVANLVILAHANAVCDNYPLLSETVAGTPASGVVCQTPREKAHVITQTWITAVMEQAMANLKHEGWSAAWPSEFDIKWMGKDADN